MTSSSRSTTTTASTTRSDLPQLTPAFREHRLQWLQGSNHDLKADYQLLLLIQPNCPGCLVNSIPVANAIAASSSSSSSSSSNNKSTAETTTTTTTTTDFDTYCVSTAFEDFELNTMSAARQLLHGHIGGTAASSVGDSNSMAIPQMPFAYDYIVDRDDADEDFKEWALEAMLESARVQLRTLGLTEQEMDRKLQRVSYEALPEKLGELFWSIKAEGSPTWVIHKKNGEVVDVRFGYLSEKEIRSWVSRLVPTTFHV